MFPKISVWLKWQEKSKIEVDWTIFLVVFGVFGHKQFRSRRESFIFLTPVVRTVQKYNFLKTPSILSSSMLSGLENCFSEVMKNEVGDMAAPTEKNEWFSRQFMLCQYISLWKGQASHPSWTLFMPCGLVVWVVSLFKIRGSPTS